MNLQLHLVDLELLSDALAAASEAAASAAASKRVSLFGSRYHAFENESRVKSGRSHCWDVADEKGSTPSECYFTEEEAKWVASFLNELFAAQRDATGGAAQARVRVDLVRTDKVQGLYLDGKLVGTDRDFLDAYDTLVLLESEGAILGFGSRYLEEHELPPSDNESEFPSALSDIPLAEPAPDD